MIKQIKAGALAATLVMGGLILAGCETVPKSPDTDKRPEPPTSEIPTGSTEAGAPSVPEVPASSETPAPPVTGPVAEAPVYEPPVSGPPSSGAISVSETYQSLPGWGSADFQGALTSFRRGCAALTQKDPAEAMHSRQEFGTVNDWLSACSAAQATPDLDNATARSFFESEFLPVTLSGAADNQGLTTGYYQPEIPVRRVKDSVYSEPVLTTPVNAGNLTLARKNITEQISKVLAYGRPIDVFFMQVQGSGVLVFADGTRVRAAYDANNGRPYSSIGRILVERGAFTLEQASKQRIEDWMAQAGPAATRDLMNQNARYIFFKEETILPGEGPKGAMRVPLTDMASIAVDPAHYPYGLPVWLETTLPSVPGDYRGTDRQLLAIAQDTGKAIRGQNRADLYFGSGTNAGDLAGVMKHTARWTILLPFHLALPWLPGS